MESVNFPCVHCGSLMGVAAAYFGRHVRCPTCGQVVLTPAIPTAPAAAAPGPPPPPSSPALGAAPDFAAAADHEDIFTAPEETDDLFGQSDAPKVEMPSDPSSVVPSPPA